jgi:hypothetical protein
VTALSCAVGDCDGEVVARELCRKHYQRWWKTGDPTGIRARTRIGGRRGLRLHEPGQHNATPLETPCREWLGYRTEKGYGIYKRRRIHRWVWQQVNGPIPAGMIVMHRCDNPPCYRLDHLRLGTIAENQRDMKAKGRGRNASSSSKETAHGAR